MIEEKIKMIDYIYIVGDWTYIVNISLIKLTNGESKESVVTMDKPICQLCAAHIVDVFQKNI